MEWLVGEIRIWAGERIPNGWLECDGAPLATLDYPLLYAAIGLSYGGDGRNFHLPDMRGHTLLGEHRAEWDRETFNKFGSSSHPAPERPGPYYEVNQKGGAELSPQIPIELSVPPHTHDAEFVPGPRPAADPVKVAVSSANGTSSAPAGQIVAAIRKPPPGAVTIFNGFAASPTPGAYLAGVSGGGGGISGGEVKIEPEGTAQSMKATVDLRKPYLSLKFIICASGNM